MNQKLAPKVEVVYSKAGHDPELRDMLAALAPISLFDAVKHSGLAPKGEEYELSLVDAPDRAVVMALLAMMRYEYADAMLEARRK